MQVINTVHGQWRIPENLDITDFDLNWRPAYRDRPYIHQFGTQWQRTGGPQFVVNGATQVKYRDEQRAIKLPEPDKFKILVNSEVQFDWSWHPDDTEPEFIWVFGNQYLAGNEMPTLEYAVGQATQRKYVTDVTARLIGNRDWWRANGVTDEDGFDFTWHPHPYNPPQIYQWEDNGPTYIMPNATDIVLMKWDKSHRSKEISKYVIKTTIEDLIEEHKDEVFWALNPDISYSKFDFQWRPDQTNFMHVNVFGNSVSKDTQTYYINGPMYALGHKSINYVEDHVITLDSKLSMFWIDTGSGNVDQFVKLQERFPQIQKTRFLNSWTDTITRCIKKTTTKLMWILSSELDYTDFEFDFYPATWQMNMIHVFGTQWSHWGNTYLINSETFAEDTKWVKVIEHLKNINHVRGKKAKTISCQNDILYIDHGNLDDGKSLEILNSLGKKVYYVDYDRSYLNTIRNWISSNSYLAHQDNYTVWVTSSVIDYSGFDFTWQSDPFQREQIHVFASELDRVRQKFGDTFKLNVAEFCKYADELVELELYEKKINYVEYLPAKRLLHPVIKHTHDSQVQAITDIQERSWPYCELVDQANCPADAKASVISLWDSSRLTVSISTTGASQIIVPRQAVDTITDEIYDYPHIDRAKKLTKSKPLDIVFISNGESVADSNYDWLQSEARRLNLPNRITRVKDVVGRVASQHAAAASSNTNWYFLVNGKLKVSDKFDWQWQPDRLQLPKHYIFSATNPVNGLSYGHQAIVANNRQLTFNTSAQGLDFTLDSLHEVVDMNSGTAMYNTDIWTTWRTAFREAIKLSNNTDDQSRQRLMQWLSDGIGDFAEWSQRGAKDGVEYFTAVNGQLENLRLSYDWAWIQRYFNYKYSDRK